MRAVRVSPTRNRSAGRGAAGGRSGQAAGRRHDAAADHEAAARRAVRAGRSLGDRGALRHPGIRRRISTIGAMTTHDTVSRSDTVRKAIPALATLAAKIGDPQVRNRGTIGGSIANNDPTADYPAAVLALGATIVTDKREIAADDFFKGLFETALAARRDHHGGAFPAAAGRRLRQAPQSGVALCDRRRVRREVRRRRARRGDRCRAVRLPCRRDRGGADARTSRRPRSSGSRSIPRRCRATSTPTPNIALT